MRGANAEGPVEFILWVLSSFGNELSASNCAATRTKLNTILYGK